VTRFIQELHPGGAIIAHTSDSNSGAFRSLWTTTDGIDVGGRRLAAEVTSLLRLHPQVTQLSIVGLSMGGLIARAALADIARTHPSLMLCNFITMATPHVGVRGHLSPLLSAAISSGLLGISGAQLLLRDAPVARDGSSAVLPLLAWMAHPASPHHRALARFTTRIAVANLLNDDRVPYWSAALADSSDTLHVLAGAGSAAQVVQLAAPSVPHVSAVFRQMSSRDPSPAMPAPGLGDLHPSWSFVKGAAGTCTQEARMTAQLRSMGGWTNVDALFTEPPDAGRLGHRRCAMAGAHPPLADDLARFVYGTLLILPQQQQGRLSAEPLGPGSAP
jgi:hypothetical protein